MAVDPEVNGASRVNEAVITLETQIHSALLEQFSSACVVVLHFNMHFMNNSPKPRNMMPPKLHFQHHV